MILGAVRVPGGEVLYDEELRKLNSNTWDTDYNAPLSASSPLVVIFDYIY